MAVVGFDFGSQNCFISVARGGGIEAIINDYSLRYTPSYVTFSSKKRFLGVSSKNQALINYKNTVFDFKNFLARKYSDVFVEQEIGNYIIPFEIAKGVNDSIEFKVDYADEKRSFTPEQITAMLFTKLKHIAETHLNVRVSDCVISCPTYFTDSQRRSLLIAAQIADLNCLRLCDDLISIALAFCVYKGNDLPLFNSQAESGKGVVTQGNKTNNIGDKAAGKMETEESEVTNNTSEEKSPNLPEENDTSAGDNDKNGLTNNGNNNTSSEDAAAMLTSPNEADELGGKIIVFLDMGHQALQANVCRMYRNRIKVIASVCEPCLGGRDFDMAIFHHFMNDLREKYKLPSKIDIRARLRLLEECAKVKKLMSANSTPIPINLESFTREDLDVTSIIKRDDFEKMVAPLLKKVENVLKELLKESKLTNKDVIDRVEVVGGSTRMPAIKSIIKSVFNKEPHMSLNTDEAVSNGCAIQCAILSPTFKVRDVTMCNVQPYPLTLMWKASGKDDGYLEIFPKYQEIPYSKYVTFYKEEPFSIEARYSLPNNIPFGDPVIGVFNVMLSKGQGPKKVKVKVRIDANGLFRITSCNAITLGSTNPETLNQEHENNPPNGPTPNVAADTKKAAVAKPVDIPVESHYHVNITDQAINSLKECEADMCASDSAELARENSMNALEECVYETRDNLSGTWEKFADNQEKNHMQDLLNKTSNWLDDEGYDSKKQMYVDKLNEIKKSVDPIVRRYKNFSDGNDAFSRMHACLNHITDTARQCYGQLNSLKKSDEHKGEFDKIDKAIKTAKDWTDSTSAKFAQMPKNKEPTITVDNIRTETQKLETATFPVLQKLHQAITDLQKPPNPPSPAKKSAPSDPNFQKPAQKTCDDNSATAEENIMDKPEKAGNMDID